MSRSARWLFAAWLVATLLFPVVLRLGGDDGLRWGLTVIALLQVGAVLVILRAGWSLARTAWAAATIVLVAWAAEAASLLSGVPFGTYLYTPTLQPQLAGVPLFIPLAWLMMLPPAWGVARCVTGTTRGPAFVALSALALTAWDLFADPQATAWGLWSWQSPVTCLGAPWTNYLGWLALAALLTALLRPRRLPAEALAALYAATWGLQTVATLVIWQMPVPALFGFVGMGSFLAWAWWVRARARAGAPNAPQAIPDSQTELGA